MVVDTLTATFTALGDPTRRSILDRLSRGPATVGELAEPFQMSQQAVSKHLAYLERARLIEKHKLGRQNVCSLRAEPIREIADWAAEYRRHWDESFDRLEEYLAEIQAAARKKGGGRSKKRRT